MLSLSEYPVDRCWVRWRRSSLVRSGDDVRWPMLPVWACGWFCECEWLRLVFFGWYKGAPYLKKLSAFILHTRAWGHGRNLAKSLWHNPTCNSAMEQGNHLWYALPSALRLHFNCFFASAKEWATGRQDDDAMKLNWNGGKHKSGLL